MRCTLAAIWLESRLHNPSLPDVLTIFWVHIVVIALTFILRTLHTQELVVDGLEQRLDSLEQRLEQEIETVGSGWLVVTDSLEQHLEEEVKREVEREPEALEAMYPRSFLNTRGVLSEGETPEAINMSLDSPESPEEAGAAAMSPSPDTTYEAEEEADMLLNQAETGAVEEPVEVKAESPVYVAQGLSPD